VLSITHKFCLSSDEHIIESAPATPDDHISWGWIMSTGEVAAGLPVPIGPDTMLVDYVILVCPEKIGPELKLV
jgi:hypothetical protein